MNTKSIDKEVFEITPGEWTYQNTLISSQDTHICDVSIGKANTPYILLKEQERANTKAICKAINGTYGKGINPDAMEEMYSAAWNALKTLEAIDLLSPTLLGGDTLERLQTALNNAKL